MAVSLCETGKTGAEVGRELGIRPGLVCRWRREFGRYREGSFSGNGNPNMTEAEKENARLRKELRDTQIERDILKKAVGIFSKDDSKSFGS